MSRAGRALALSGTVALSVAFAGTAAASIPISAQTANETSRVAVGPDGTGYFTWAHSGLLWFCRVLPGATACQNTQSFTVPDYADLRFDSQNIAYDAATGQILLTATGDANGYTGAGIATDTTFTAASSDGGVSF